MIRRDYHVHTCFCDGKNTPREIAEAAYAMGMTVLGFSGHGYTEFDSSYCMSPEDLVLYRSVIEELKEEYCGRMDILCGVERDYYAAERESFDFVIGSVHYILAEGEYIPVDESPEILKKAADRYFGGDMISLAEKYFENVGNVAVTECDIIGHFDLISKFNENYGLFDESDPRYVKAWTAAADRLIPYGRPFEINTGAITRGYRVTPYPRTEMIGYIKQRGGCFILSSDSHSASSLCYGFDELEYLL